MLNKNPTPPPPLYHSHYSVFTCMCLKKKNHYITIKIKVKNCRLHIYLRDHARVHHEQWKQNRCHVFIHFTGAMNVLLTQLERNQKYFQAFETPPPPKKKM